MLFGDVIVAVFILFIVYMIGKELGFWKALEKIFNWLSDRLNNSRWKL